MAVTPRRRLNRGPRPHVLSRTPAAAADGSRHADPSADAAAEPSIEKGNSRGARRPACEACGHFANVQLLAGYRSGHPVRRRLCIACAKTRPQLFRPLSPSRHLRLDAALALAGIVTCLLGVVHDYLPTSAGGFGWQQLFGVFIGATILVLGLLTRADYLAACGVVVLGLAGTADLFLRGGSAGIGWKQGLLIVSGLLMVLAGLRLRAIRYRLNVNSPAGTMAGRSEPPAIEPEFAVS